jgi:hypothetical protein
VLLTEAHFPVAWPKTPVPKVAKEDAMTSKSGLKFSVAAIDQARETLKALPPAPRETKEVGLREAIEELTPTIRGLLGRGYTRQQVVELLQEQGVGCSLATLKTYFRKKPGKAKAAALVARAAAPTAAGQEAGSSTLAPDIGAGSSASPRPVAGGQAAGPQSIGTRGAVAEPAQGVATVGGPIRTAAKAS